MATVGEGEVLIQLDPLTACFSSRAEFHLNVMKRALFFAVAVAGICLCTSQGISCTATQTQNGTFYTVSEITTSDCHHSWINGSGSVLVAEDGSKHKSVVASNITSLHMNGCHEKMEYSRLCPSVNHKESVMCYTNCTSMMPQSEGKEEPTHFWIVWMVLGLLLPLIAGILSYRFRHKLSSWCSYRAVKQQSDSSNTEDVETQGHEMNQLTS